MTQTSFRIGVKYRMVGHGCSDAKPGDIVTVIAIDDERVTFTTVNGRTCWYYFKDSDHQLEPLEKTLDNLEVGDIIVASFGKEKRVIDVLPNSVILNDDRVIELTAAIYSIPRIKSLGWTVKQDSPTETTELSVAEIESKLGLGSGTLRVKKDD